MSSTLSGVHRAGLTCITEQNVQLDMLECICGHKSPCRAAELWVITTQTVIVSFGCWLTWLLVFFFLCPEGQRGAEGGDCLADSPADVLGDHRQHVLLWRWALWARAAALTPARAHCINIISCDNTTRIQKAIITKNRVFGYGCNCCAFIIYIFYVCVTIKIHPTMSGRRSQAAMRATWLRTHFVTECPILCLRCVCRLRSTEPWSATASLKRQITHLLLSCETRIYKVKVSVFFAGEPMMSLSYAIWWSYLFDVIVHNANI